MTLSSLQTSGVGSTQPEPRSLQHSRRQTPAYRMGRWQPASGEIHALVWQVDLGAPGTVGCQWKSPGQSPYAARGRQRSYRPWTHNGRQRSGPCVRQSGPACAVPKLLGSICKRIQPAFDVRRIGCLAPARMSPVRSRCCRRAFFTQHVTVRTLHCRPPSVAVRSGGTCVVVEPGRMPATDCDQAALCTAP